jgi:predicted AlkP superfamily phosphohydrolase/phosphomutase
VLIGLDGTDDGVVQELLDAGRLPALAALRARGRWGILESPRGFSDTASWTSFSTCWTADRHGWVSVRRIDPATYDLVRIHRWHAEGVPFWQWLSDAGRTVTVLDVPKSPVGQGLRGVELTDWLVHTPDLPDVVLADPPEFADEVLDRHGAGHGGECAPERGADLSDFVASRIADACRVRDLTLEQLAARDADLVITVFGSGHCVGHAGWGAHVAASRAGDADPVVDLYEVLDREVGRIVEAVGPNATVIVFSIRGMTVDHIGTDPTDEVLRRLDTVAPAEVGRHHKLMGSWRRWVPHGVRKAMPTRWHRTARQRLGHARGARSYFALEPGGLSGGVRVNVVGREPTGVVPPEDLDATLDRLSEAFLALVDADTGEPVVDGTERVADRWPGPRADALPDLFVHWTSRPGRAITSEEVGEIERSPSGRRYGHHTDRGWLVAAGPGIAEGPDLAGIDVCDLGPTAGALLGVEIPDADGRPIPGLLSVSDGANIGP